MAGARAGGALRLLGWLGLAAALSACSRDMGDLQDYVERVKARPGGRIEPLPQVKPYETFGYAAQSLRSPFIPTQPTERVQSSVRPDRLRNREFLENFPLDDLRMVGSLEAGGRHYGLVQTSDGLIHRVVPGNHLGQNDGRIISITDSEINLVEIIPDGLGGYMERPAAVALSE